MQKRSGNVYENKGPVLHSLGQSRNVVKKKGRWYVVGGRWGEEGPRWLGAGEGKFTTWTRCWLQPCKETRRFLKNAGTKRECR